MLSQFFKFIIVGKFSFFRMNVMCVVGCRLPIRLFSSVVMISSHSKWHSETKYKMHKTATAQQNPIWLAIECLSKSKRSLTKLLFSSLLRITNFTFIDCDTFSPYSRLLFLIIFRNQR